MMVKILAPVIRLCWNISLQFYQLFKIKSLKLKFVGNN